MDLNGEEFGEDFDEEDGEADITPEELELLKSKFVIESSDEDDNEVVPESDEDGPVQTLQWKNSSNEDTSDESDNEVIPAKQSKPLSKEPQLNQKRKREESHSHKKHKNKKHRRH